MIIVVFIQVIYWTDLFNRRRERFKVRYGTENYLDELNLIFISYICILTQNPMISY